VLHIRASKWFEQHGDVEESIAHAIAARDVGRASDLVSRHAHAVIRGGRIVTLMRWLDELSWGEALADPQLAVIRALAAGELNSSTDAIESWLMIAESGSHDGPLASTMPSLEFGASLVRARFLLGGVARAAEAGRRASAAADNGTEWRLEALFADGQTLYLSGQASAARKVLEEALLEAKDDAPQTTADILAHLALIELDRGDVERGEALAQRGLAQPASEFREAGQGGVVAAAQALLEVLDHDGTGALQHRRVVGLDGGREPWQTLQRGQCERVVLHALQCRHGRDVDGGMRIVDELDQARCVAGHGDDAQEPRALEAFPPPRGAAVGADELRPPVLLQRHGELPPPLPGHARGPFDERIDGEWHR